MKATESQDTQGQYGEVVLAQVLGRPSALLHLYATADTEKTYDLAAATDILYLQEDDQDLADPLSYAEAVDWGSKLRSTDTADLIDLDLGPDT